MPRLDTDTQSFRISTAIGNGFEYTGAGLERVAQFSTQQTLVTLAIDLSGSMESFEADLDKLLKLTISNLKKLDSPDSIMVRVIQFNSISNVREVHGFKPLMDINESDYAYPRVGGGTPLYDSFISAIEATVDYAKVLNTGDFLSNAIIIHITDGADVGSKCTSSTVKQSLQNARSTESLESILTILIGVNDSSCSTYLKAFKSEANLDHYIRGGDLNDKTVAKLIGYISQSVASQSSAIGTGSASQAISTTI